MGKSNSKLKAEVLEELTRKTYCEYHRTVVTWYCCDGTRGAGNQRWQTDRSVQSGL